MWLSQNGLASATADVCKVPFRQEAKAAETAADRAHKSFTRLIQQQAWQSTVSHAASDKFEIFSSRN